jgi:hypothetical protein
MENLVGFVRERWKFEGWERWEAQFGQRRNVMNI